MKMARNLVKQFINFLPHNNLFEKIQSQNILIIYENDGLANTDRLRSFKEILKKTNAKVNILNSRSISNFLDSQNQNFWKNIKIAKDYKSQTPLYNYQLTKAYFISQHHHFKSSKIIVCQTSGDFLSYFFKNKQQIFHYDCPTPYTFELENSPNKKISLADLEKLRNKEKEVYKKADLVSFNWDAYKNFTQENLGMKFKNYLSAPTGTKKKKKQAKYKKPIKIVYVGSIDEYWNNKKLLLKLIKSSKFTIDIYGKTNDPNIRKLSNFKGYLAPKKTNPLSNYQFGLITISKDKLRKKGFSAKSMLYLSYGLPILVPQWRKDKILTPAVIDYNSKNFDTKIAFFSQKKNWAKKNKAVLELSQKLRWSNASKELLKTYIEILESK